MPIFSRAGRSGNEPDRFHSIKMPCGCIVALRAGSTVPDACPAQAEHDAEWKAFIEKEAPASGATLIDDGDPCGEMVGDELGAQLELFAKSQIDSIHRRAS